MRLFVLCSSQVNVGLCRRGELGLCHILVTLSRLRVWLPQASISPLPHPPQKTFLSARTHHLRKVWGLPQPSVSPLRLVSLSPPKKQKKLSSPHACILGLPKASVGCSITSEMLLSNLHLEIFFQSSSRTAVVDKIRLSEILE